MTHPTPGNHMILTNLNVHYLRMHSHKFQLFWTNDFEKKIKIVYIYIGKNLTHPITPHPLQWRESWFEQLKYIHLRTLPQKFQRFWSNGFFFRRRFFNFILYILQCRNSPPPPLVALPYPRRSWFDYFWYYSSLGCFHTSLRLF